MYTDNVIVAIEPSNELSEMIGFPYFIEKRFTIKELLDKNVIDDIDVSKMKQGVQICKKIAMGGWE